MSSNGDTTYGGAEYGGGTGESAQVLTGSIAQNIKKQIVLNLNALVQAGVINSVFETDLGKDPLQMEPSAGYPFAIVGMPIITADYEDQATNKRTYEFKVLVAVSYEYLADQNEGIEGIIDAFLNQFDNNFTLAGAAQATVLPIQVMSSPISTAAKSLVCFVASIKAQALYQWSNANP
jgi:hypothetical protein